MAGGSFLEGTVTSRLFIRMDATECSVPSSWGKCESGEIDGIEEVEKLKRLGEVGKV